jgi:cytochrome bd-type quinol oxidase subunit 2
MEEALGSIASWFQSIGYSDWARFDPLAYPVANVVHLLGLVMLVGGIGLLDLRTAGLWRALPLNELSRILTPIAVAGLLILIASGTVLFAADGEALARSTTFQLKLILIAIALANIVLFHWLRRRRRGETSAEAPLMLRALALVSLTLWLAVGTAGRMIAYS